MAVDLKGRDFLSLKDFTVEELWQFIKTAEMMKLRQKAGEAHKPLNGKTLGMIFQKASTRTRVSFEVAAWQLGGYALYLSANDLQLGRGETVSDTGKVLSRYLDGIMIRTYEQSDVEELAEAASIPIINGLTDLLHPCQVLADLQTVYEKFGRLEGLKLAFVGDGNNMAHSLMYGCAKMGMRCAIATPPEYGPDEEVTMAAREIAAQAGGDILVTSDIAKAVHGADVVYTDVWASMGQEEQTSARHKAFAPYQVTEAVMAKTEKEQSIFMHCLPAHRGEEMSAGVIDGRWSVVFDQAENRLHAQKAILALVM